MTSNALDTDTASSAVAEVIRLVHEIEAGSDSDELSDGQKTGKIDDRPTVDSAHIVSILGDRGSGKTVALYQACRLLAQNSRYVVHDVIRPEFFEPGDTLYSVLLANLMRATAANPDLVDKQVEYRGRTRSLLSWIEDLAFKEVSGRQSALLASSLGNWTVDEQAAALVSVSQRSESFANDWRSLAESLLPGQDHVLVIPVDDADLAPRMLPQLLLDLRKLGSTHRVVCVTALSYEHAKAALASSVWEDGAAVLGSSEAGRARREALEYAEAALTKSLPTYRRVHLRPLSSESKLAFRPIGSKLSFERLLGEVPISSEDGFDWDFGDLFRVQLPSSKSLRINRFGDAGLTPYCEANPSASRDLEYLFRAIERQNQGPQLSAWSASIHILREAVRHYSGDSADRLAKLVKLAGTDGDAVDVNFTDLEVETRNQLVAVMDVGSTSRFRSYGHMKTTFAWQDEAESLPESLVQAILLILDIAATGEGPGEGLRVRGRSPFAGGFASHLLDVSVDGQSMDSYFLMQPAWERFSDHYAFMANWEWFTQELSASSKDFLGPEEVAERLLIAYLTLVADVQSPGSLGKLSGRLTPLLDPSTVSGSSWRRRARTNTTELEDVLTDLYRRALRGKTQRDSDFVLWFERFLPFSFHPLFRSSTHVDDTWQWWSAIIRESRRWRLVSETLGRAMSERVRQNLGEEWIDPILEGLRHVEPRAHRQLSPEHLERRQSRLASRIGSLGAEYSLPRADSTELPVARPRQSARTRAELFEAAHQELARIRADLSGE